MLSKQEFVIFGNEIFYRIFTEISAEVQSPGVSSFVVRATFINIHAEVNMYSALRLSPPQDHDVTEPSGGLRMC